MTVSTSDATPRSRPARKKRRYSDGHPLDHVQYVESKLILKGDRFSSVDSFRRVRQAGEANREGGRHRFLPQGLQGREAAHPGSSLPRYARLSALQQRLHPSQADRIRATGSRSAIPRSSSSFATPICRRRPTWTSAPSIAGDYRIKFKAEALPLKDEIGGVRTLYSHNAQFPLSHMHAADRDGAVDADPPAATPARHQDPREREGRARQPHGDRGGPPRHRDARFRQGGRGQGQRGGLAHARRREAAGG